MENPNETITSIINDLSSKEFIDEEQSVDELVQESVEEHVQESAEEHVQESVEEHVQESVENKMEDLIDESIEEQVENHSTEDPELKLEEIYKPSETETENIQMTVNETVTLPPPTPLPPIQQEKDKYPTLVFIVPYRDRKSHYDIFSANMKMFLRNAPPYKIFYVHQTDNRNFNRGAMKNIGFLAVKKLYPENYKNITLVFNDIDTMPTRDIVIKYETQRGIIKHFYGFDYTLGGIVSINAGDFEVLNGFPNFWAWGFEDNMLQNRALKMGMKIDRSVFYKIMDPKIIHLVDTFIREVNRGEYDRFMQNTEEGINSIRDLVYNIKFDTGFVDVLNFETTAKEILEQRTNYDIRNGPAPFKDFVTNKRRPVKMKMVF